MNRRKEREKTAPEYGVTGTSRRRGRGIEAVVGWGSREGFCTEAASDSEVAKGEASE